MGDHFDVEKVEVNMHSIEKASQQKPGVLLLGLQESKMWNKSPVFLRNGDRVQL